MNWILARLREPSTWRGLVWLLTVTGIALKPEQTEAVIAFGMAAAGLLGVFLKDPTRNPEERTRATDLPPIDLQGRAGNTTVSTDEWMHIVVPPRHRNEEYNERGLPPDHPGWGG